MKDTILMSAHAGFLLVVLLFATGIGVAGEADAPKDHFELHVVADFYDDLLACHFTEKTPDEMMRIFQSWGVRRVYWNGQAYASGLYDAASTAGVDTNALGTYQEMGEFIPAAARPARSGQGEESLHHHALPGLSGGPGSIGLPRFGSSSIGESTASSFAGPRTRTREIRMNHNYRRPRGTKQPKGRPTFGRPFVSERQFETIAFDDQSTSRISVRVWVTVTPSFT